MPLDIYVDILERFRKLSVRAHILRFLYFRFLSFFYVDLILPLLVIKNILHVLALRCGMRIYNYSHTKLYDKYVSFITFDFDLISFESRT